MKMKSYTAARAKAAREQLGLERSDVADRMVAAGFDDWTANTQANVENDRKTKWTPEEMLAYATALKQDLFDLFPFPTEGSAITRRQTVMATLAA